MAAKTNEQLVLEFQSFIPYIQSLGNIGEAHWETPIQPGKWSLKEMLSHIMLWDKYFYEEAFAKVKAGQPLTAKHQNFNEFNARAIEYAQTVTWEEIIRQFILYRSKMIEDMDGISEAEFLKTYPDGDGKKFSYRGHLRGFIPHDKHHRKQMEQYIHSVALS